MADSKSEAVGDKVEAAVTALGIKKPGVTPDTAVPVSRRKAPALPSGKEPPEIVVTVGDPGPTEYLTARDKMRTYPVSVTIIAGTGTKAADDMTVRQWRDQIDAALDTRAAFAGLAGFVQVEAGGGPPFDQSALSKDFNYSVQTFRVSVSEART